MSRIFINYRRSDTPTHAGRLYEWLSDRYGADAVFMDVDTIQPGLDFADAIDRAVGESDVVITLIGREWVVDVNGRRRLDDPEDFVRLEIETALDKEKRVIPVLVEGAEMPKPELLPESLQRLTRRHAFELSDRRWQYDKEQLLRSLDSVLGKPPPKEPQRPPEPEKPPISTPSQPARSGAEPAPSAPPAPYPPQPDRVTAAPDRAEEDPIKGPVKWGWIFTGATLLLPLFVVGAVICGILVLVRGGGRKTGTGIAIIAVSGVLFFISAAIWSGA